MNYKPNAREVGESIKQKLARYFGTAPEEATKDQLYKACAMSVKDILTQKRSDFRTQVNREGKKRIYYMSIEFLLGRSLKTNLHNLELAEAYNEALAEYGTDLDSLYECEPDAGLGNGGLGRLAACFMDSLTSLDYPACGFSLCYEYGLFKQRIIDGVQIEIPDVWLPGGEVWLVPRTDRIFKVRFGGTVRENWREDGRCEITYEDCEEIEAVTYDMMISGYDCAAVNQLRLWKARDIHHFNMGLFTQGQYTKALEKSTNAEILTKSLYPSDNHIEGKLLRLSQQYFLASASTQSIVRDHMAVYGRIDTLPDKVSIHINDTHPALCIPELMRILIDDYTLDWDTAWDIVTRTVSYTNHTVMPEALETWQEDLFRFRLPRIYMILKEINERFCKQAWEAFPGNWNRISNMSIISYGQIKMANLSVIASHTVNGVSKLHSQILVDTVFKDFYHMYHNRFDNVTNGIAHRRWLCFSNPQLAGLLDECIGTQYRKDPKTLSEFIKFADDKTVLDRLGEIKYNNKVAFANYYNRITGKRIDPNSVFDVQIKRLHEYKRQLLNALNIISLYIRLKDNPNFQMQPMTFLFGAKAAPGYDMAKRIIKLICCLSEEIEKDPVIREKLRVVFLEDYNVSLAEKLIPSAEISEQISLAGKEASGTGCMKLMINGAMTIGTLDGANVEMLDAVGEENISIFGLNAKEVEALWLSGYRSVLFYGDNAILRRVVDSLNIGFNGESFSDIAGYLLAGYGIADPYMCLADFESYRLAHLSLTEKYADKDLWNKMSLKNIAAAGHFAADRSIREYADRIWKLKPVDGIKK